MMIFLKRKHTYIKRLFLGVAVLLALFACTTVTTESVEASHWSYNGKTGPAYWHKLGSAYAIAKNSRAQSPIDIVSHAIKLNGAVKKPVVFYTTTPFKVENSGHTIRGTPLNAGNVIVLDGETYVLRQFQLHSPSEHMINGRSFAMELHLVHKSAAGAFAIVGIMITEGAENKALRDLFKNMPAKVTEEGSSVPEIEVNLLELFPDGGEVYRYDGSLTAPPCIEGVKWTIFARPITMSRSQIDAFKAIYTGNKRPVQKRYGRPVYLTP
jgi:carbonic anhydrase